MKKNISELRVEYSLTKLNERDVDPDPILQFRKWLDEAISAKIPEPNAMTLATATFQGKPSARMVLLKLFDERGFGFFTNYESKKAKHILQNPYGSLVFWWSELERQVRIEGKIEKVSEKESDKYFKTRPEGSKIGAWASPQSMVIQSRRYLETLKADYKEQFENQPVARPVNWGGYILIPELIEFWQGRPNRLHDRIEYIKTSDGWTIRRLAP